jgi:hypothetical protein
MAELPETSKILEELKKQSRKAKKLQLDARLPTLSIMKMPKGRLRQALKASSSKPAARLT